MNRKENTRELYLTEEKMKRVIVIGGGAAGMMAAIFAARNGNKVTIYEKNEKLGKKLFITGKGRCNITNACDIEQLFQAVMTNRKFLYSSFYAFDNQQTMEFFKEIGLQLKVERGERVFPVSDKSSDVIKVLENELRKLKVDIHFRSNVKEIIIENDMAKGVVLEQEKRLIEAEAVIIATGGKSYEATGSTGDGYQFASKAGHMIKELQPSLVPFEIKENFCKKMQGLSLKNIKVTVKSGKKTIYEDMGEMLFTHFGISGPLILTASTQIHKYLPQKNLTVHIDLKPALSEEELDIRVLKDFNTFANKQFKNALDKLLPKKMIPIIIELSGIDSEKKVNAITKEERHSLVHCMKNLTIHVSGLRGFQEAIITKGGIHVKEVNPGTMESQLVKGLYFCGEVLDLDAVTGGYNLQIAWSTGYLAGSSV